MGIYLEYQNRKARTSKYIFHKTRSSWISKNMILSGLVVLAFLALHFYDFWVPEMDYKYVSKIMPTEDRYYHELQEKFHNTTRTVIYCISFVLLGLHLNHGLASSFQSVGVTRSSQKKLKFIANVYSLSIAIGFTLVAIFHYFSH
tara:strand:+ start:388 stop:822 length:435 start_codon:yes stop_codon:yes gene_type:complete